MLGPKTLCNACGVKRTRKLRAEQEGAKRRKLSASPAPPASLRHYPKYTARTAPQPYNGEAEAICSVLCCSVLAGCIAGTLPCPS